MDNSIPICRSILEHWIYKDAEYLKVWLTMLSRARYIHGPKTVTYQKALCVLNYGEFIFGYKAWSEKTGISYQRLRGLIKKLLKDEMLELKTQTNHFSVYEITNYAKFNSQKSESESISIDTDNSQVTVSQQSGNSQVTTNEECIKKEKKDKENINVVFDALWKLYPKKEGKGQVSKTQKEKLAKIGLEEMTRAINRYIQAKSDTDKKYWKNGSTFFNSGYVDYLDANYQEDRPNATTSERGRVEWR